MRKWTSSVLSEPAEVENRQLQQRIKELEDVLQEILDDISHTWINNDQIAQKIRDVLKK